MNNFSYGFRMEPQEQDEVHQQRIKSDISSRKSQEEDDDLFVIGNKKIQNIVSQKNNKQKKDKKEKKQRKDKKQKKEKDSNQHKQKHKSKKKKDKKIKKKQRKNHLQKNTSNIYSISSQSEQKRSDSISNQKQKNNKVLLYSKNSDNQLIQAQNKYMERLHALNMLPKKNIEKGLNFIHGKTLQERIEQDFAVNQKIQEGLLLFDIINFPMNQLLLYGNIDKDVPVYQRAPNYPYVIGVKKSKQKKYKKIMLELNKMIQQKQTLQNLKQKQRARQDRYFNYEGYQRVKGEFVQKKQDLMRVRQQIIKFSSQYKEKKQISSNNFQKNLKSDQQKYRQVTKEYNIKLNQQPNNIQIWLKFLQIQDQLFVLSQGYSIENKQSALAERKLTILEKALQKNPYNDRLGIEYFNLLFKLQKSQIYQLSTEKQIIKFIQQNPQNQKLWFLLLHSKLHSFQKFSHTFIKTTFQQFNNLIQNIIKKTTSAQKIWKIRTASLKILSKILQIYNEQGYFQLSTTLGASLLQFNIFMPQKVYKLSDPVKKKEQFRKYFQNYHCLKIGDSDQYTSWETCEQIQKKNQQKNLLSQKLALNMRSFIGNFQQQKLQRKYQEINQNYNNQFHVWHQKQQNFNSWRPANLNFKLDKLKIKKSPQTFILIQDIEHALLNYRDHTNILILIDIFVENMGFPTVFKQNQINSKFSAITLEFLFSQLFSSQDKTSHNYIKNVQKYKIFSGYWLPQYTQKFFSSIQKILYIKRILKFVKLKLKPMFLNSNKIQQYSRLNEYLLFIIGCIYINPLLSQKLGQNDIKLNQEITQILSEQPDNCKLWALYIEFYYMKSGNSKAELPQIFKVFQQWMNSLQSVQKKVECLYWYSQFKKNTLNEVNILSQIFSLFLQIHSNSFSAQQKCIKINSYRKISSLEHLQIQKILFQKMEQLIQFFQIQNQQIFQYQNLNKQQKIQQKLLAQAFYYSTFAQDFIFLTKNEEFIDKYMKLLVQIKSYCEGAASNPKQNFMCNKLQEFVLNSQILNKNSIYNSIQPNVLQKFPYLSTVISLSKKFSYTKSLNLYQIHYNQHIQKKNLVSWIWTSSVLLFIRFEHLKSEEQLTTLPLSLIFLNKIVAKGKKLAFESIQNQNVSYIKLLLKMCQILYEKVENYKKMNQLTLDSIYKDQDNLKNFYFKCINKLPYCKQLYLGYLKQLFKKPILSKEQCMKIVCLIEQKQLRIAQKSYRDISEN